MSWMYLMIASLFEVGWPVGLKMAALSEVKMYWFGFSIITMTLSGIFLYLAQKGIPVGTAYAIWSGIGASCTFLIGIWFFHDAVSIMRLLGILLIVGGVVCLKFGH